MEERSDATRKRLMTKEFPSAHQCMYLGSARTPPRERAGEKDQKDKEWMGFGCQTGDEFLGV